MTDMESMDRAVEEAREMVINEMINYATARIGVGAAFFHDALDDFEAAVSAKARAEERERLVTAMVMAGRLVDEASLVLETALLPTDEPARSSEEARNG